MVLCEGAGVDKQKAESIGGSNEILVEIVGNR
jgi:hypothetical protein